jgi:hypothetical protein
MSTVTVQTDWWTLELPEEWRAQQEDDAVLIHDEDEVSWIELSTLERESGDVDAADLANLTVELRDRGLAARSVSLGPWSGEQYLYREDDEAVREWYLYAGPLLVFVTHSCHVDHAGMDDSAVDEILATLEPVRAS